VHCNIANHSIINDTGELTAIGEAIAWISLTAPSTTSSCSDSTYANDAIDLTDLAISPSSKRDLIHLCLGGLSSRRPRRLGHFLLFRKVKAHCNDKP